MERFFCFRHEVEGDICFYSLEDSIRITCHWPYDRSTGEWIDVSNEFSSEEYIEKVSSLDPGKKIELKGLNSGSLSLLCNAPNSIQMDLTDSRGSMAPRFILEINVSKHNILP